MKNILLSAVALVALTAGAVAADLPMRAAPPAPVVAAVPVFTWTGFYVGVNGGYAFGDEADGRRSRFFRIRDNGDGSALGGAQIGYNMQFGMFVAGIEADAQAIDLDAVYGSDVRLRGFARRGNDNDGVDGFGTVRGRLGLAFDRALVYATGGLAWRTDEDNNRRFGRFGNFRNDDDNIGWTVGGGVEYAFTNNLSAKVEGLYVDFSENNDTRRARGLFGRGFPNLGGGEFGLVRAGLNYRFGTW
jgi:outer membrane immunogenic protein